MLRQRFDRTQSPSYNRISPSPKPCQLNSYLKRVSNGQAIEQHRRNRSVSVTQNHSSSLIKPLAQNKMKHLRKHSHFQQHSQSSMKKSFALINSKIQNILENYKQYDRPQNQSQCKEKYLIESQVQKLPKNKRKMREMNKQNLMVNSKEVNKITCSMKCLKQVNLEQSSPEKSFTEKVNIFANQKSFLKESSFSDSNSIQEVIKRPKIFEKLKINCDKKLAKQVQLVSEQQSQRILLNQKDKLVHILYNQILLDERFIKAKCWFKNYKKQHKWWLLERQLKKYRFWINQLTMKATFMTKVEEQNPDQVINEDQFSVKTLVLAFKQAQEHWLTKIRNNFDFESLKRSGFMESSLDLSRKGHIQIEDLIRFINLQLKTFYSTRQLQLIFIRLKQSEHLEFYDIIEKITRQMTREIICQ